MHILNTHEQRYLKVFCPGKIGYEERAPRSG